MVRDSGSGKTLPIPAIVMIAAFVSAIVAVVGWTNAELKSKVDRTEYTTVLGMIQTDLRDIKGLLNQHMATTR